MKERPRRLRYSEDGRAAVPLRFRRIEKLCPSALDARNERRTDPAVQDELLFTGPAPGCTSVLTRRECFQPAAFPLCGRIMDCFFPFQAFLNLLYRICKKICFVNPRSLFTAGRVTVHSAPFAKPRYALSAASQLPLPGLRHFIFDRFLKNALFTAFRQYFFVKFPAFYCCMVLYIYLACVIIFL